MKQAKSNIIVKQSFDSKLLLMLPSVTIKYSLPISNKLQIKSRKNKCFLFFFDKLALTGKKKNYLKQ